MAITSLTGVGGVQQSQNITNANAKLQAIISSIVRGQQTDSANISIATQLQSATSGLRQASNNIAQASSLTEVASGGVGQIQNALTQLQSLAQQASSPILNSANRSQLDQQFKQILNTVDQIATGTSFNGQNLLNGDLNGSGALSLDSLLGNSGSETGQLAIGNLGTGSLLAGVGDITTPENAATALGVVNNALAQATGVAANIGAFQQTLNFASANIDSAITNQEAAQSTLSDTDLAAASTQKAQDEVQRNAAIALAAQGNNLNPVLLKLVG